jgi:ABC-type polysaccharide transport system permease subunit
VLQILLFFPAPIALALLLSSIISTRVRRFVQTVVYLPYFISWVIVISLFQQLFGGDGGSPCTWRTRWDCQPATGWATPMASRGW